MTNEIQSPGITGGRSVESESVTGQDTTRGTEMWGIAESYKGNRMSAT